MKRRGNPKMVKGGPSLNPKGRPRGSKNKPAAVFLIVDQNFAQQIRTYVRVQELLRIEQIHEQLENLGML